MKSSAIFSSLLGLLALSSGQLSPAVPRFLGSVQLPAVAFLEAYMDQGDENSPMEERWTLYISTFNPINGRPDPVYMLRNLGIELSKNVSEWELFEMSRTAVWPNNPDKVPFEVFNTEAVIWASGFLVPPKTAGRLEIFDTSVTPPVLYSNIASLDTSDWSYHRSIWKDMDGDGDLDVLTARFFKPILGETKKQFLWLENPNLPIDQTPTSGWAQHILKEKATDVHFRNFQITSKDGIEYDCILSAEFFNEQLVLYYTSNGNWTDWSQVETISLDTTLGQTFDVYVDDFNQDGRVDLLVTAYNHSDGHVFAWEIPEDFPNGTFVRHTVADGFKANPIIGGQSMTPGSPKPFYPSKAFADEILEDGRHHKPYIMVSGDDDGKHYILEPASEEPTDWTYVKHVLVDTEKTTSGKFAIGDFDGDGFTEIIAAGYSSGTLYAFTYTPEP